MMNPASLNIGGMATTRWSGGDDDVGSGDGGDGGDDDGGDDGAIVIMIIIITTRLPPYQTYYERTRPTYSYRWTKHCKFFKTV